MFTDEEIPKIFINVQYSFNQDFNVVFSEIEQILKFILKDKQPRQPRQV